MTLRQTLNMNLKYLKFFFFRKFQFVSFTESPRTSLSRSVCPKILGSELRCWRSKLIREEISTFKLWTGWDQKDRNELIFKQFQSWVYQVILKKEKMQIWISQIIAKYNNKKNPPKHAFYTNSSWQLYIEDDLIILCYLTISWNLN